MSDYETIEVILPPVRFSAQTMIRCWKFLRPDLCPHSWEGRECRWCRAPAPIKHYVAKLSFKL